MRWPSSRWYEGFFGHHEQARALMEQALDGRDADGDPFPEIYMCTMLTDLLLIQHAPPDEFETAGGPGPRVQPSDGTSWMWLNCCV